MNLIKIFAAGLLFITIASCAPETQNENKFDENGKPIINSKVIYGSDGRLDLYQVSDERLKRLADSTVALVQNSNLTVGASIVTIKGDPFGSAYNLCASEKFQEQSTAAFCSGSLVGPDTIITAGHCIKNQMDCNNTSFVFGYAVKSAGIQPTSVPVSEVYKCKSVVKQVLENTGADYAIVKIDRVVANHAVLQVRQSGEVAVGDPLVVIGHPTGLPTKVTGGGQVRSISNSSYILASVDTYGGNSGSAVFNPNTGFIEGILVRGEADFIRQGSCMISNVCAENACRGEDITRISQARPFIPGTTPPIDPPVVIGDKFTSTQVLNIPDNLTTGVSGNIAVNKLPGTRKVYVTLNLSHTYIGDLVIKVTSPSGKTALLHSRAGGNTDDIKKSYEVTSSLGSELNIGNYKIQIQDLAAQDVGRLNSLSIEFK